MASPDLVVTADWHLRPGGTYRRRSLEGDAEFGLEQIARHCAIDPPAMVVVLGDVFEAMDVTPASPAQHRRFREFAERVATRPTRFGYLLGNHDRGVDWPSLGPAEPLHGRVIHLGERWLYGLNYTTADRIQTELGAIPRVATTLLAHQAWGDLLPRGSLQIPQAYGEWLPPHVRAVISGDYHRGVIKKSGAAWFYSPGPICMQTIAEPADKVFLRLAPDDDASRGGGWTGVFCPLKARPVMRVVLDDDAAVDGFLAAVPALLARYHADAALPPAVRSPILDVRLGRRLARRRRDVATAVGGGGHLFLHWAREDAATLDAVPAAATGALGLRIALRDYFPPGRLRDLALRLEAAADLRDELDQILREETACTSNASF